MGAAGALAAALERVAGHHSVFCGALIGFAATFPASGISDFVHIKINQRTTRSEVYFCHVFVATVVVMILSAGEWSPVAWQIGIATFAGSMIGLWKTAKGFERERQF